MSAHGLFALPLAFGLQSVLSVLRSRGAEASGTDAVPASPASRDGAAIRADITRVQAAIAAGVARSYEAQRQRAAAADARGPLLLRAQLGEDVAPALAANAADDAGALAVITDTRLMLQQADQRLEELGEE